MKKEKAFLRALIAGFCALPLIFGAVSCSSDTDDDETNTVIDQNDSGSKADTVTASVNYASSADYWTANSGTISVSDGVLSVSGVSAEGIAIQLNDSTWSSISSTLGTKFYVQAVMKATTDPTGNKNIGPASIVDTASGEFAYAGVNTNGRTQLGTKTKLKGAQFGSLISDTSLLSSTPWEQYYTLRYEYDNGTITGYINGIQFNKSGTTSFDASSYVKTLGSVGIYACANDFEMTSFVCGPISDSSENEDTASLLMTTSEGNIVTLTSGTTKYVFLNDVEYTGSASDDPITFDISAVGYTYNEGTWSYEVSDTSLLSATRSDNTLTVTILSPTATTATVTIKNDAKAGTDYVSRVITVNIEDQPNFTDSDYGTLTASPSAGATGVYEDDHLELTFDDTPVLSESNGQIYIYDSDDTLVDTLQTVNKNTVTVSDGTNSLTHSIPAAEYNVRIDGSKLVVIPHQGVLETGKTYKVVIADGVISGTINGVAFTGFTSEAARWSFTTRDSAPTETANIIVGSSDSAHYRTVQSAIVAAADGATITVEPGTYREFLFNKVAKSLTIVGSGTEEYGADVVIEGSNGQVWASGSDDRCLFLWGGKDLVLKNLSIVNDYDRNVYGTAQSEAMYFNSTYYLAAYNCSFKGHQDTLLTKGRNWYYKCYIEGDTDFIWGYADVALFEECKIVQLDTSSDTVPASGSYIFETRVSSDSESTATVGKGYVLFNSTVTANHSKSYLARRASASTTAGTNYYDQSAAINVTLNGTWQDAFGGSNSAVYIEKDSDSNMNVGVKYYGGTVNGTLFDTAAEGTISSTIYNAEYSGRNVILNRVYKKSGKYVNADSIWDISSLENEFNCTADEGPAIVESEVEGANGTYDILALAQAATTAADSTVTFVDKDGKALTDGTSSDSYLSWSSLKNFGAGYGVVTQAGSTITIKLAGPSVVTWTGSIYSKGNLSVTESAGSATLVDAQSTTTATDKISQGFLYTGSAETTVTLAFAGTTYVNNIVVKVLDDETNAVSAITLGGSTTLAVGDTSTLTASVTRSYLSTDDSVTWTSSNTDAATVDSNGVVTAVAAGTATITATSVATSSVSGSVDVTVNATAATAEVGSIYTWNFVGLSAVPSTVSDSEGNGLTLTIAATTDGKTLSNNSGYGLYGTEASYSFPVAGDATIIAYATYLNSSDSVTLSLATSSGTKVGTDQELLKSDTLWGSSSDHKPANGPVAYVWRYTGDADTLVLTVPAAVYMGQIVADNTASETALTACSYDFTASDMATPLAPSTGSNKIHWYGSDTAAYKNSTYGIQTLGPTFFSFYVGGACDITFTDTYDQAGSAVYLYEEGNSEAIASVTTSTGSSAVDYTLSYTGTTPTVLRLRVPKNVYISTITVE